MEIFATYFPILPIKLVIDVFRSLHLYDLVELLEKALQPRTLRPALPLKEIATLLSYSNRPTTFYSKVKIVFVGDGEETFDTIGNVFKKICPGSKISRAKPEFDLSYGQLQRYVGLLGKREDILNGEFEEKKKKVEADISSAFDKSWGEERG